MDKHSTLMIHEVSSGAWGKVNEIKASSQETERLNEYLFKLMAENCGKDDNFFLKKVHEKKSRRLVFNS